MNNHVDFKVLLANHKLDDKNSTMQLINNFKPLINKYAYKLDYEDTYSDLIEHLIVTLNKMPSFENDGQIISYISTSLKNEFLKLSKVNSSLSNLYLSNDMSIYEKQQNHNIEVITHFLLFESEQILDDNEKDIILKIFFHGFTHCELAKEKEVSRQTIYNTKKRALSKLKEYIA